MPGPIVQMGASAQCPHGGTVQIVASGARVLLNGMPATTSSDQFLIAGCPFFVGNVAQPCMTIKWLVPAMRVKVNSQPVVLQTSTGLCQAGNQAPQGPPLIVSTQTRVVAS